MEHMQKKHFLSHVDWNNFQNPQNSLPIPSFVVLTKGEKTKADTFRDRFHIFAKNTIYEKNNLYEERFIWFRWSVAELQM